MRNTLANQSIKTDAEGHRPTKWWGGFVVLALVTFVIFALRAPELLTKPQFWAEDGVVFFAQQYGDVWPHIFSPWWGYLVVLPRLIAWLVDFANVAHAPLLYGVFGLIIDALCVAYVTKRSSGVFVPVVVWFSFAFTPNDGLYFGYIANIQWFAQFVLIAMCLYPVSGLRTNSIARKISGYVVVCACALTGPMSVIIAILMWVVFAGSLLSRVAFPPKYFWRAIAQYAGVLPKDRMLVLSICAVVQLAVSSLTSVRERLVLPPAEFLNNVFGSWPQTHFFGMEFLPPETFVLVCAFGVCMLLYSKRISPNQKLVCVLVLAIAACELFLGAIKPGAIGPGMMGGDRYYYLGKTGAWWVIALLATPYLTRANQRTMLVLTMMLWISMLNIKWMQRGPLPDMHWKQQAEQINAGVPTPLQINPWWWDNKVVIRKPLHAGGEVY